MKRKAKKLPKTLYVRMYYEKFDKSWIYEAHDSLAAAMKWSKDGDIIYTAPLTPYGTICVDVELL